MQPCYYIVTNQLLLEQVIDTTLATTCFVCLSARLFLLYSDLTFDIHVHIWVLCSSIMYSAAQPCLLRRDKSAPFCTSNRPVACKQWNFNEILITLDVTTGCCLLEKMYGEHWITSGSASYEILSCKLQLTQSNTWRLFHISFSRTSCGWLVSSRSWNTT